jgi:two-component system sensor histidine kinase CiaH
MFKKARIKLTLWYLVIIMAISLSFSALIYGAVNSEFQRRLNAIEYRLDLRGHGMLPPTGQERFFIEDLNEARIRVFFILLYTNGLIFAFSAIAGYFLAGKTLKPIERTVNEQKRFIADASHELKTPLTSLQTSIEVTLRNKKLTLREAKSALKDNLTDIARLTNLTKGLLTLTSYQQNGDNVRFETVEVSKVIKDVKDKFNAIARDKKVKLRVDVVKAKMKADKDSLEKLFTILFDNAIKYTDKGGKVSINLTTKGKNVTVKVKDNGIGIAKEEIPKIFNRFYQTDPARAGHDGFGLGLAIAKHIVNLHKGKISVSSKVGKGSIFIVKLPTY